MERMRQSGETDVVLLYHGSRSGLVGDIVPSSRSACDFGRGFYLGTEPTQPLTLICRSERPTLYSCELDLSGLRVYRFQPDIDWVLFISYCRNRMPAKYRRLFATRYRRILSEHDVIFGKIANDKMFYALDFFFDNLASDTAVLKSLEALSLGDQYCARTRKACRAVTLLSSRVIGAGECAKLQRRSDTQRTRDAAVVDRIMDENRRDGLLFKELLEKCVSSPESFNLQPSAVSS